MIIQKFGIPWIIPANLLLCKSTKEFEAGKYKVSGHTTRPPPRAPLLARAGHTQSEAPQMRSFWVGRGFLGQTLDCH